MGFRKELCLALILMAVAAETAVSETPPKTGGCEVPIASRKHYRYRWPLVFTTNGELYPTEGVGEERKVVVDGDAQVLLSCGPNYLKNFNKKEVLNVRCNGASGNFSVINDVETSSTGAEMSIDKFSCDLRVIEEILSPVDGCTNEKWSATSFGYVDPKDKMAVIVGEACYDTTAGRTIFAHVKLGDTTSSHLRKAERTLLTRSKHPDIYYKVELFQGFHFDEIYERIRTQLQTKHAPPLKFANFIDESLMGSAQMQAVKKLGWNYYVQHDELEVLDTLKADIRSLSENLNLNVFVGSHGVRTLVGNANEKMEMYLHPDQKRFPMPALIWIVVRHEKRAMAFGIFNEAANTLDDMSVTSPRTEVCTSDCGRVTWLKQTLKNSVSRSPPLVCCTYEDLKKTVQEVPVWEDVNELLL